MNEHPSVEAMKAAVALEIEKCLGFVTTQSIGHLIQKAIDAALSARREMGAHATAENPTEDEVATELYAAEYDRDTYPFADQTSAEQLTYRYLARAILAKYDMRRRG